MLFLNFCCRKALLFFLILFAGTTMSVSWDNSPLDCPYPCLPPPTSVNNCPPPPTSVNNCPPPPPAQTTPTAGYPPPPPSTPSSSWNYPPSPPAGYYPYYYPTPPYFGFPAPPPPNPILPWFPWYYKKPPSASMAEAPLSVKAFTISSLVMAICLILL